MRLTHRCVRVPVTVYKWLARCRDEGPTGLEMQLGTEAISEHFRHRRSGGCRRRARRR
jgi:hypothetical protein